MQLNDIRRAVEHYSAPGAPKPSQQDWAALKRDWAALKPTILAAYHPIIDDRIALVERR